MGDQWEGVTLWHSSMTGNVHNSHCHKLSTMGSWRGLMRDGAANLPILLHEASEELSQACQGKRSRNCQWVAIPHGANAEAACASAT